MFKKNLTVIIIVLAGLLDSCQCERDKEDVFDPDKMVVFSGYVVNSDGAPITGAVVNVNGLETQTGEEGFFKFFPEIKETYLFSINAEGYGDIAKQYKNPMFSRWVMSKATVATFDAANDIVLTDTEEDCPGSLSENASSINQAARVPLVYNADGQLIGFEMPAILKDTYEKHVNRNLCNSGVTVRIRGGSLRRNGSPVTGNVKVSVSTIDLFAPDGMPGDYSVSSEQTPMYMVSLGAGNITVTQEGEELQLDPKSPATIEIPVDPALRADSIPQRIPFLTYNEERGEWIQEGFASINEEGTAYVAQTTHFSSFNMDHTKVDPSCIRFCFEDGPSVPNPNACYPVEVTIPEISGIPKVLYFLVHATESSMCPTVGNLPGCLNLHFIRNLPNNRPIGIRVFNPAPGCPPTPSETPISPTMNNLIGTYVLYTGGAAPVPDCSPGGSDGCAGPVILSETVTDKILLTTDPATGPPPVYIQNEGSITLTWSFRIDDSSFTQLLDEVDVFEVYARSGVALGDECQLVEGGAASPGWGSPIHTETVVAAPPAPAIEPFVFTVNSLSVGTPDFYEFKVVARKAGAFVAESTCITIDVQP